jgi:hypothetical protein
MMAMKINYIDMLDHLLDMTIVHDPDICGDLIMEEIETAHARGAISKDVVNALYDDSEIQYYITRLKYGASPS